MKLLLTSNGLTTTKTKAAFLKLLPKPASSIHLVFIPTAAEPYGFIKSKQDKLVQSYLNLGIKDIDILNFTDYEKQEISKKLHTADVLVIGGGNTFYLLKKAQETGLLSILSNLITKDIVYVGMSAGSIIAGPDITICTYDGFDKNTVGCTNYAALGFVPFTIFPHYDPIWESSLKTIKSKLHHEVIPLRDDQAIIVNSNNNQENQNTPNLGNGYYKII